MASHPESTVHNPESNQESPINITEQGPILRPKKVSSAGSSEVELDGSYLEDCTPEKNTEGSKVLRMNLSIPNDNDSNGHPGEVFSMSESMQGAYNYIPNENHPAGGNLDGQVQSFSMNNTGEFELNRENNSVAIEEDSADEAEIENPDDGEEELSEEDEFANDELHLSTDHVSQSENAEADQYLEMESAESDQLHHGSHLFDEESSQRYEPEGQYQGAYDRNLPGAQGYAPVMPPNQGHYGSIVQQDRHEPVRQWVLNIDPNPNPEDDQMIDVSFNSDHGERYGFVNTQNSLQRQSLSNSDPDIARRNVSGINQQPSVHRIGGQGASSGDLARADVLGQSQNSTVNLPSNGSYHVDDSYNHHAEVVFDQQTSRMGTQTESWAAASTEQDAHDSMEAETQTSTHGTQDQGVGTTSDWSHLVVRQEAGPGQASTQPSITQTSMSPPVVSASSHKSSSHGSVHSTLGASLQSLISNQGSAASAQLNKQHIDVANNQGLHFPQKMKQQIMSNKLNDKPHSLSQNTVDSGLGDSQVINKNMKANQGVRPKANDRTHQKTDRHEQCLTHQGNTDVSQRQTPQGAIPKQKIVPGSKGKILKTNMPPKQKVVSNNNSSKLPQRHLTLKTNSSQQQRFAQGQIKGGQNKQKVLPCGQSKSDKGDSDLKKPTGNRPGLFGKAKAETADVQKTGRPRGSSAAPAGENSARLQSEQSHGNVPSMSQHLAEHGINISPIRSDRNQPRFPDQSNQQNFTVQQTDPRQRLQFDVSEQMSSNSVDAVQQILDSMGSNTSGQVSTLQSFNNSTDIDNMMQMREHLQAILGGQDNEKPSSTNYKKSQDESRQGYVRNMGHMVGQDSTAIFPGYSSDSGGSLEQMLAYSAKYFSSESQQHPLSQHSGALNMETKFFKDAFEKERYRRKHCEEQIQNLQRKQLENQEQLAVAIEMDRKKDHMIQQLDKTLAVVVEKWKKTESDRQQKMTEVQNENDNLKRHQFIQEQAIEKLENELKLAVERLGTELQKAKETLREKEEQLHHKNEESQMITHELQFQRTRNDALSTECEGLNDRLEKLNTKFAQLKDAYEEENVTWEEKEKEYLEKIESITENHMKLIEEGKEKLSKQINTLEEKSSHLTTAQKQNKQLEIDLDTLSREKESLKVQLSLMEAKFESNQRKLEAEFLSQLEEKISEVQEEIRTKAHESEEMLREKHRQQVHQLNQKHSRDTEAQMAEFRQDLQKREDRYRDKESQLQEIVSELKGEISELKESLRAHESQRNELASKLPAMMQAHCNEALRLLQQKQNIHSNVDPVHMSPYVSPRPGTSSATVTVTTNSMIYNPAATSTMYRPYHGSQQINVSRNGVQSNQNGSNIGSSIIGGHTDHDISLFSALSEGINLSDVSGVSEPRSRVQPDTISSNYPPVSTLFNTLLLNQGQQLRTTNNIGPTNTASNYYSSSHNPANVHSNTTNLFTGINNSQNTSVPRTEPEEPIQLNLKPVQYEGTLRAHRDTEENNNSHKDQPYEKTSIRIHFKDDMELLSTQQQALTVLPEQRHTSFQYESVDRHIGIDSQKQTEHISDGNHANLASSHNIQTKPRTGQTTANINHGPENETPNTVFHNLSAQNHQGMEFIRKQIEEQRSSETGTIMLHPPVQLDLSGLQAAQTNTDNQHHSSASSGSDKGQQKVTWRLAETSFESGSGGSHDTKNDRQHPPPLPSEEDERSVDYNDMAHRFDQHESRQAELQRYIKMLLQKPPSSPPVEQTQPPTHNPHQDSDLHPMGLSPTQMGEITRLVGMYKQTEQVNQDMQDVLSYLKEAQENRYEQPEQPGVSPPSLSPPRTESQNNQTPESPRKPLTKAKRNLESTYKVNSAKQQTTKAGPSSGISASSEKPKQSNVPAFKQAASHNKNNVSNGTSAKQNAPKKTATKKPGEKTTPAWK